MTPIPARVMIAVCVSAAWAAPPEALRWKMQYLYDEAKTELIIADLQFPSARRGVAVGTIVERGGRLRPGKGDRSLAYIALVTSDGGEHWESVPLKERPSSLFFLNETSGWMVTAGGLWKTTEAGRNWRKLPNPPAPINRVYFADENAGWAACGRQSVLATQDGGRRWTPVTAPEKRFRRGAEGSYTWIAFANPQDGLILGWNVPPQDSADPLEPQRSVNAVEMPYTCWVLATGDRGKTWKLGFQTRWGEITRVRFGPDGKGLALVEHSGGSEYPAEIHRLLLPAGESKLVFRHRMIHVTDMWVAPDGASYLAGTLGPSRLDSIVPQKVFVARSLDLKQWTPLDVDYRAVANRVVLAGADGANLWMATNNGMILKLDR
ncbi:MAG: hypothetical protein LAQ30_17390 [Acidobacteriia bacterium]|nr:hypothetical protein [Terriglobia bacterium]